MEINNNLKKQEKMRKVKKMKRIELLRFRREIENVHESGSKFCYALAKNKRKADIEIEDIKKARNVSDEYTEFIKDVDDLKKEYTKKDENGQPVIIQKMGDDGKPLSFYDIENAEDKNSPFRKAIIALEEKNVKVIEEFKLIEKEYIEVFLEEESKFDMHYIRLGDIPKDISQKDMDAIFPMINDDSDEDDKLPIEDEK